MSGIIFMNREKAISRFSSERLIVGLIMVFALLSAGVSVAHAQGTLQNASLFGTLTDSSGASLPGGTVTVTSTALQGAQTATTDGAGSYRIEQLPPGIYQVKYSMAGFEPEIRTDVNLTSGFNARIDVALKVGATSQSVQVTGASPVVDTATTSALGEIPQTVMEAVPSTRAMTDAVYLAPGVRPSATPDIGGSDLGAQQGVGAYGFAANVVTLVEGVDVMQQSGGEHGGPTGSGLGQLPDYDGIADLTIISTGAQADIGEAGPVVIVTMKSGSNQWHGDAHFLYEPHGFQLTNLPANSPGLGAAANQLQYFYDIQGDVGGKIKRDKLWFWAGYHPERNNAAVYLLPGPGGVGQGYNPTHQDDVEGKVTYQPSKSVRIIGDFNFNSKFNPYYTVYQTPASGIEPSYHYLVGFWNEKGEVIWTPSSKWIVDILGGYKYQYYSYPNQPGVSVAGNPYTYNQTTGITSGADFNITQFDGGSHDRIVYTGTGSYLPNGKHQLQFGLQLFLPDKHKGYFFDHPSGNYELITCNAGSSATCPVTSTYPTGTPEPYQFLTFNFPFKAEGKENAIGEYVKDTWRATKRLTVNAGVRYDYYKVFNDGTKAPSGPFSLGATYPALTVNTWNRFTPRIGVAYDLTGSGKSVIRGSYGMYNIPFVGELDLVDFNPASLAQTTYNWSTDTCQVTAYTHCAPSAAFISAITGSLTNPSQTTFNGKNIYTTTSSAALAQLNPHLRLPFLHEASVQFEHELMPNLAVRATYVYMREEDMYDQVFPNRPITAYTVPYQTTYPAPDPVNGGKPLTIYTYPASYAAANQYIFANRASNKPDFYNALSFSLTKRQGNRWGAGVSADFTKDHRYLNSANVFAASNGFGQSAATPVAPYQLAFPLDLTWDYTLKSYVTSLLPYSVTLGLTYEFLAGTPNYTTDQITGVPFLGTVTMPVNQYGSNRNPDQNVMSVRAGRVFKWKERNSLEPTLELFNALNAAPAETVNYINGTGTNKFGYVSAVMPPFIGRFGVTYRF
jgi:Carboxypeptidase regulatory-like domain/TonB dependent receptor